MESEVWTSRGERAFQIPRSRFEWASNPFKWLSPKDLPGAVELRDYSFSARWNADLRGLVIVPGQAELLFATIELGLVQPRRRHPPVFPTRHNSWIE